MDTVKFETFEGNGEKRIHETELVHTIKEDQYYLFLCYFSLLYCQRIFFERIVDDIILISKLLDSYSLIFSMLVNVIIIHKMIFCDLNSQAKHCNAFTAK